MFVGLVRPDSAQQWSILMLISGQFDLSPFHANADGPTHAGIAA
jgi:hypothetical protein